MDRFSVWSTDGDAETRSPCIRQCTLDEADECVGCGRMLDEILGWAAAPAERKDEIRAKSLARLAARRARRRG